MSMIEELRERHRNGPGYPSHLNGDSRGKLLDEIAALESKLGAVRSLALRWAKGEAHESLIFAGTEILKAMQEPPK